MKQMARQMELFHLTGIRFCSATLMDLLIKKVVIIFVLCRSLSLEMRYRFVSHVLIILKHAGWLIEFNECGSFSALFPSSQISPDLSHFSRWITDTRSDSSSCLTNQPIKTILIQVTSPLSSPAPVLTASHRCLHEHTPTDDWLDRDSDLWPHLCLVEWACGFLLQHPDWSFPQIYCGRKWQNYQLVKMTHYHWFCNKKTEILQRNSLHYLLFNFIFFISLYLILPLLLLLYFYLRS